MSAECCESFARMDVRGKTVPDNRSCRAKTSSTKRNVTTNNRERQILHGVYHWTRLAKIWGGGYRYIELYVFNVLPQSGHAQLTKVSSMCSWTPPCASSLVPSVLHLSHGFQCSPTLNRQPYEGRLPLTSWWRKSSNMTVSQSSLISLTHHCYDWHPGSCCRCGWTCNQLTSKVDAGVTGSRLRWSTLT